MNDHETLELRLDSMQEQIDLLAREVLKLSDLVRRRALLAAEGAA